MGSKIGDSFDPTRKPPELNPQQPRKVEAVEKISETDPDQQARKQKFRQLMGDEDSPPSSSLNPSPFDPSFHRKSDDSYNYAPIEKQLPSSSSFLSGPGDLHSPDHPLHVEEEKKKEKDKKEGKKFEREYPLFTKIEPQDAKKDKKTKTDQKTKSQKSEVPLSIMGSVEEKSSAKHLLKDQKKKEIKEASSPVAYSSKEGKGKTSPWQDKEKKETSSTEEESSSPSILPHEAVHFAEQATLQASNYLSPETEVLYATMVGNIYCYEKTNSGIATTEISLTSPIFANSRFFGATITLEKYDTDPSSFNIRLTGSNEAVRLFNQNIKTLYAAFQNGNFRFRIGRLEAEYSVEKPLFHRKESSKGKDMGGGQHQRQN